MEKTVYSAFTRFSRCSKLEVWDKRLNVLAQGADLQNICINRSGIGANTCAASMRGSQR